MDSSSFPWIALIIVVSLLTAGLLGAGLAVGYWRGFRRGQERSESADLDKLAGVGRAILSAQLRLDALCEIVYQQSSRIVDTSNFQLGLFDGDDYLIKVWVRDSQRLPEERFCGRANTGRIADVAE